MLKRLLLGVLLVVSVSAVAPSAAQAQSDILLRLRSGSPLGDRFRVDSAGSVVAIGQLGIGIIPATGCGYRMMWYSYRGSFRAGSTHDSGACDYWDDGNQGFFSWAGGNLTKASAYATFAFGDRTEASSSYAIAFGRSRRKTPGCASRTRRRRSACAGWRRCCQRRSRTDENPVD